MSRVTSAERIGRASSETSHKLNGICSTCINVPGCAYVETRERPKLFCEQFESDGESSIKTLYLADLTTKPATLKRETKAIREAKIRGLCANCGNGSTCIFPQPEGGVWHCEEYC